MQLIQTLISLLTDALGTLKEWVAVYGSWVYALLFLILFCETGLVVTPFLPGDSLLFAAGAIAGAGLLNIWYLYAVVFVAVILGDNVNYAIGRFLGTRIMTSERGSRIVKPAYVERTEHFFAKHGGKTISLARFFPIIRTYAPFMAGLGQMAWPRFFLFSFIGTIGWVTLCLGAGWFLGGLPFVQEHFELIVIAIILVTLAPSAWHAIQSRRASKAAAEKPAAPEATESAE
jgi:membrane-associated protein